MRINESVKRLQAYTPGEQPKTKNVIKLNTNENPYPPSPKCAAVLKNFNLDTLRRYPDPVFSELRQELARLHHARPENIFIGNGSDEVLSVAAKTFVEDTECIGSLDPSYSLYQTIAAIRNVKWVGVEDPSSSIPSNISLFIWANPNSPTGAFRVPLALSNFARKFPGVLLIDEAYADFARTNCMSLATSKRNGNILVMRTFSKSYSLAGLRVGYCVGPKGLIDAMYKVKDSYNVDTLAQALALAAIKDQAWMKNNVDKILKTREQTIAALTQRGWNVLPSEANFVFARPPAPIGAANLYALLKKRNVFIRYFSTKSAGDRLRISIGSDEEMAKALAEIDILSASLSKQPNRKIFRKRPAK